MYGWPNQTKLNHYAAVEHSSEACIIIATADWISVMADIILAMASMMWGVNIEPIKYWYQTLKENIYNLKRMYLENPAHNVTLV